ncbi:hypothetical protein GQ600_25915 [Phytophthora cactorum]|nr:hypothetical protein GQ600_25915 [Phytophthora cactorum]
MSVHSLILPFTIFTNRQVATFYFQQVLDAQDEPVAGYVRCRRSRVRQQAPRTGYSNLVSHVRSQHPDFEEVKRSAVPAETGTLVPWIRRRSLNLFGWLRWTVMCYLPLHFCENPETRRYSNLDPIGEEQLLEGIACMTGRTTRSTTWRSLCLRARRSATLPLSRRGAPVQAPSQDLSARRPCRLPSGHAVQDYGKTLENCIYLLPRTCLKTSKMNWPSQGLDDQVEDLNQSAKLRFKTKLRPVLNQATRWSSTFCMVNRYVKLLGSFRMTTICGVSSVPCRKPHVRKLLEDLKKIESVSKELQSKSVSIADVRSYFDALIELWPEFTTYLGKLVRFYTKRELKFILVELCAGPRAAIVHNPHFEAGCVKVQRGESAELTRSEKAALSQFTVLEAVEQPLAADHETTGSFVEQVKKKRKTSTPTATYMLLQSPPPPLQTRWSAFSVWPRPPSAFNGSVFNQLHWR